MHGHSVRKLVWHSSTRKKHMTNSFRPDPHSSLFQRPVSRDEHCIRLPHVYSHRTLAKRRVCKRCMSRHVRPSQYHTIKLFMCKVNNVIKYLSTQDRWKILTIHCVHHHCALTLCILIAKKLTSMVELWMLFVFPLAAIDYFNLLMSHACVLVGASGETHSCLLYRVYTQHTELHSPICTASLPPGLSPRPGLTP